MSAWRWGCYLCWTRPDGWRIPSAAECPGDIAPTLRQRLPGVSVRTVNALARHGVDWEHLSGMDDTTLSAICLIGPASVGEIRRALCAIANPYRGGCS